MINYNPEISSTLSVSRQTLTVIQVTQNGSIRFDDGSLVSNWTLAMLYEHPEIILHAVQVAGKRGDALTFWQ